MKGENGMKITWYGHSCFKVESGGYSLVIDPFNPEMLPWLRTFIGRIVDLKCSSQYVLDMFREDLARMDALYGGGDDAI